MTARIAGPWHVDHYDALGVGVCRYTVSDEHGALVAAVYGEDAEAIANLLAAAPVQRAALKELLLGPTPEAIWRGLTAVSASEGRAA